MLAGYHRRAVVEHASLILRCQLTDNEVFGDAHLGEVVVVRNGNDVRRIDLADHNTVACGATEVGQVLFRANVQTVAALARAILINLPAFHLRVGANAVVEPARVDVLVIPSHLLVGEEAAIRSDRNVAVLKEIVERQHAAANWILEQVL